MTYKCPHCGKEYKRKSVYFDYHVEHCDKKKKPKKKFERTSHEERTDRRQEIIDIVMKKCREDGEDMIYTLYERLDQNIPFLLVLEGRHKPTIRMCLKYYRTQYHNEGLSESDGLLLNQMITNPDFIDPEYIPKDLVQYREDEEYFQLQSATYDTPSSASKQRKRLNPVKSLKK